MGRGGGLGAILLAALALGLLHAPPAEAAAGDASRARSGLDRAVSSGRLAALDADRYRRYVSEAVATANRLSSSRRANLNGVLRTVAAQAGGYDTPRAVALFEMLRFNTEYLARRDLPPRGAVVRDADGIAYRSVPGIGLQYHPLASFGKLNAEVNAGRYRASIRLAFALVARGRPQGSALVWETYYSTSGGRPPWTSGMTQAVAAQALARVGLRPYAWSAFVAVRRGLLLPLPQGPWIRLYHFNQDLVLNAQLQAAISIGEYGRLADDRSARQLAAALRHSAAALLPRFDTGDWSLYALGGGESEITYHGYVASLLWKLQARTGDPQWGRWAARFRFYWRTPPRIRAGPPSEPVLPVPADGHRDTAPIRFWVSKPGTVTLRVAGEKRTLWVAAGSHTLVWEPGERPPGEYVVLLSAVDKAGNRTDAKLAPVTIERDNEPPEIAKAALEKGHLAWRAADPGTPWLDVRLVLRRGAGVQERPLGKRALRGRIPVPLPAEAWHASVVIADSSGNRTVAPLGTINRHPPFVE